MYSQLQCKTTVRPEPPKAETEWYWRTIWEDEKRHNFNAQWLQDLRANYRNLPEQKPVTITVADVQQQIKNMKSWTAPGPDMIHTYWLNGTTKWLASCTGTSAPSLDLTLPSPGGKLLRRLWRRTGQSSCGTSRYIYLYICVCDLYMCGYEKNTIYK